MKKIILAILLVLLAVSAGNAQEPPAPKGFLLNMYHFNIQYVVGDERSMNAIVVESFEPLVDWYLAHPGWGADFEMQGMMVEYLGEKHPKVLEKFKRLINSGQCDLVSFHLSDALLLAYPAHDQEWSLRLNDALLAKYGIKRSGVIFAQEEQFGEGYGVAGASRGYRIAIMSGGAYGWNNDDNRFPFFESNGLIVLPGAGPVEPTSGIKAKFQFLGDGELVVAAGISPYFPGLFRKNLARLKVLEEQFNAAIKEGYQPSTVTQYVDALLAAGVKPQPLKPTLDSPWRVGDGSGVFQWMGKYSLPWERDYDIRTKAWQTRSLLIEAERAGAEPSALADAWYHMLNVEVSDQTGWYPLPVEIKFAYDEMEEVKKALARDPKLNLDELVKKAGVAPGCGAVVPTPLGIMTRGKAAKADVRWSKMDGRPDSYCVAVKWTGKGDGSAAFPWTVENIEYSPAMMENIVRVIPVSQTKKNPIHLALTNGLIGLGGGWYLVRDNNAGVVAAKLDFAEKEIAFQIQNGREDSYTFRFYLLQTSADDALKFANEVNRVAP